MNRIFRRLLTVAVSAFLIAGCEGDTGPAGSDGLDGQDAVDTGAISVTVNSSGGPVAGATVTTDPATISVDTDATGVALLADIPIGVYDVTAEIAGTGVSATETAVNVAAGLTSDVSLSLRGVPGAVSGTVMAPDGTPVEGATVSAPGSADVTTDAAGAFVIDAVVSEFLSVAPPAGSTLLAGGTRHSVRPGDIVSLELSGGPEGDALFMGSDVCLICHQDINGGLVAAWQNSGHYRVIERSLIEMDMNGWPADPGAGNCSAWFDTGVLANDPSEDSGSVPSHDTYIRTCNNDPDLSFDFLVDVDDDGADLIDDTLVPVYATYGGPGTQAGEIAVLQDRGEATDIHGAWKQRYMFNIGDVANGCSPTNPYPVNDASSGFPKNPKPDFVDWDTTQTCEDMLIMPIQFNQRSLEWVSYHNDNWYTQGRSYAKKCSGCHEVGITITADEGGMVTDYAAVDYRIGCEKCHGPGSSHVSNGADPNFIMNPNHMTAKAATEICGACHNRGSDPIEGDFGFPWRADATDFDGNFVAGLHELTYDAVDNPEAYFLQKPKNWASGYPKSHRQQFNSYAGSAHQDNPYNLVTCYDCHSPHSGKGGPYHFTNTDFAGDEYEFGSNDQALMSNARCLSCHATHGPFASLTLEDIAINHTSNGGTVDKNGVAMAPTATEQDSALMVIEQAVKAHNGERAGMPFAPYTPTESHIPANYVLGDGPVGRCTSCHMTKTAKSGTWYYDNAGRVIQGDNTDHSFEVVEIQAGTDQPNACGSCHASFRTDSLPPGGD